LQTKPVQVSKIVKVCVYIHQSVERKSKQFYEELRRYNYVTPTSYLELLMCFIKLLTEKRADLEGLKGRLAAGLDKLLTTAGEVEVMQLELVALQPILATTAKEADNMMETISVDKADADVTKQEVCYKELPNLSLSLSLALSLIGKQRDFLSLYFSPR
jgi:dynein heavy chain